MKVRIISALIALPIALVLIHLGAWWFAGLLVFATGVCSYEFAMMANSNDRPTAILCAVIAGLAMVSVGQGWASRPEALPVVALTILALVLWFLFRPGDIQTAGHRLGVSVTGLVWSVLFMSGLMCLRFLPDGLAWIYLACGLAWGSDTGAYFAGKFLGKKKLYPAVSPKKTWAGAVGGVVSATVIVFIMQKIFSAPAIPMEHLLVIAPIGAALGQMGDLCESLIKRSMGVKDSGKIMPGHGGMLDRVDALFFTATWLYAYAVLVVGAEPAWL